MSKGTPPLKDRYLRPFDPLISEVELYSRGAMGLKISDEATKIAATGQAKEINGLVKRIDATKKEALAPFKAEIAKISGYADQLAEPLVNALAHIKTELLEHNEREEIARQKEIARIEAERRKAAEAEAKKERERAEAERKERERIEAENKKLRAAAKNAELKELRERQIRDELERQKRMMIEAEERRLDAEILEKRRREEAERLAAEKGKNITTRWSFEVLKVTDVPAEFLTIEVNAGAVRKAITAGAREIPGLNIFQIQGVTLR